MTQSNQTNRSDNDSLLKRIQLLEQRISRIEEYLGNLQFRKGVLSSSPDFPEKKASPSGIEQTENGIEFKVGEFGLAWLGSIVLLIGIIFLMNYSKDIGHPIVSSLIGYFSVLCVFALSHVLRKNFSHLSFMLQLSAHLLLYYVSLLLHFFTPQPVISQSWIVISLLLIISGIQIYLAVKKQSKLYGGMGILLCLLTAVFSESLQLQFSLLLFTSCITLFFLLRYSWWHIFLFFLFLVYFSHLSFLLGNPIMEHSIRQISSHGFNLLYLLCYFGVYSLIAPLRRKLSISDNLFLLLLIWNGICFTVMLVMNVIFFYQDNYIGIFGILALLSLIFSVILKSMESSQFEMSFYACFGFMALSVSVYGYSQLPNTFLWLALQSLLVVSIALWFKSRLITIVNTILFLGILISYLAYKNPTGMISFTFAIVSFGSARILNWKKERLSLRTDLMRNMYLGALLTMMLYGLYHAIPQEYTTLCWTATAGLFFLTSILLKNFKYRWLAICTLFITVVYLLFVDLAHLELGYRVIAFFFLASISLGVSLYYTKRIKKHKDSSENSPKDGNKAS
ncbi:hypothetical protein [Marinifilum fragile]|uniref:hypothetical protein n=1 Tax=Marinifilum fragile TaxID=570161 RepID=UPI0006D2196D|nr:hypothetical protein [Marinifilum fragile]